MQKKYFDFFSSTIEDYIQIADEYIQSFDEKYAKRLRYIEDTMNIFMTSVYGYLPTAGEIKWPVLEPNYTITTAPLVPFNEAWSYGLTDCIVHFYIDDSQFMRVYRNTDRYLPFLQQCHGVIGPDMSQYTDMPAEMRYRHAFCNVSLSYMLQTSGVNLYPNITWSTNDSYGYSFPRNLVNSVIAINSNGVHKDRLSLYRWRKGYEMALSLLTPKHIIRYGQVVTGENILIRSYYENERLKMLRNGRKRK